MSWFVRRRLRVRRSQLVDLLDHGRDLRRRPSRPAPAAAPTAASSSARVTPSRVSAASRSSRSLSPRPVSRISSATATACSLITSCAVSRPTPWRTAAISTLVVTRNGQVAPQLGLDHRREGAEVVQHAEEGLEQPVEGEEGVRQGDPADHRAGHVALVPLVAGQLADHRDVAADDHRQPVDPLAGPGVHLVRHRAGADLAGPEALGDQLVPGHQPDAGGQVGRRGRRPGPARSPRRSPASADRPDRC